MIKYINYYKFRINLNNNLRSFSEGVYSGLLASDNKKNQEKGANVWNSEVVYVSYELAAEDGNVCRFCEKEQKT
jgi:hypothetical protein